MSVQQTQVGQVPIAVDSERVAEKSKSNSSKKSIAIGMVLILAAIGLFFGFRYWQDMQTKVYIEKSVLSAPLNSIGPETPGILKTLYVKEGDRVIAGQQLFNVGDRVTSARMPGIVTSIQNTPGQWASQQSVIVQMYDPTAMRVVGRVQEDQGLSDIRVGQRVVFTVDAFGSREYIGKVESVGETSDQSSIVFNISDKRQENQFAIKVTFDGNAYPELKNGMSAKMWVYK